MSWGLRTTSYASNTWTKQRRVTKPDMFASPHPDEIRLSFVPVSKDEIQSNQLDVTLHYHMSLMSLCIWTDKSLQDENHLLSSQITLIIKEWWALFQILLSQPTVYIGSSLLRERLKCNLICDDLKRSIKIKISMHSKENNTCYKEIFKLHFQFLI